MLLREPKHHLVADEDGKLLLQLAAVFWLGETAGDGHEGGGEEAFHSEGPHEGLDVRGEAEGDGLGVVEEGFAGDEGGDEFGAPDVSGGAGDGHFVGEAGGDVHDVGHEGEGGHLVGELFTEEEEVWVGGVGRLEVVERDGGGNPFGSDGGEDFHAESCEVRVILGDRRIGTEFVHCKEDRIVLVETIAAAVVFVDALKGDVGCVVLNETKRWGQGNYERKEEAEIATSTFFPLRQRAIEDTEEL